MSNEDDTYETTGITISRKPVKKSFSARKEEKGDK